MYDYMSSNARQLDYTRTEYQSNAENVAARESEGLNGQAVKKTVRTSETSQTLNAVKRLLMVAVGFMLAFFVVRGYVEINEADNRISEMSHELRMIEAENQAIKAKIDKSVDLKNLQIVANEKFGMVRPENYQIFYINLASGDYSESVSEENPDETDDKVKLEGVTGVLISSADMFK